MEENKLLSDALKAKALNAQFSSVFTRDTRQLTPDLKD